MAPLIHIVRHANPANYNGNTRETDEDMHDPGLSAVGINQATTLSAATTAIRKRLNLLFCSPSLRAIQTADIAFFDPKLKPGVLITPLPALMEIRPHRSNIPEAASTITSVRRGQINGRYLHNMDGDEIDYQKRDATSIYETTREKYTMRAQLARQQIREAAFEIGEDAEVVVVGHAGLNSVLTKSPSAPVSGFPAYSELQSFRFEHWDADNVDDPTAYLVPVSKEEVNALDPSYVAPPATSVRMKSDNLEKFFKSLANRSSSINGPPIGPLTGHPVGDSAAVPHVAVPDDASGVLDADQKQTCPPQAVPQQPGTNFSRATYSPFDRPPLPSPTRPQASKVGYEPGGFKVVQSRFNATLRQRARQMIRYVERFGRNAQFNEFVLALCIALQSPKGTNPVVFESEYDAEERWPDYFETARGRIAFLNLHWFSEGKWDDWDENLRTPQNPFGGSTADK